MMRFLRSESELALLLGHEIAHVDLRHCIELLQYELALKKVGLEDFKQVVRIGYGLIFRGFSEEKELEADRYGMNMVIKTRYHPPHAIGLLSRMVGIVERAPHPQRPKTLPHEILEMIKKALRDYLATHPPFDERIKLLQRVVGRRCRKDQRFYIGRRNFNECISRTLRDYPAEWQELSSLTK
jgi:predicted Zn-dependent protease